MKGKFILLLLIPFSLSAQKENNIWYFGERAGVDFNGGAPVANLESAMYTAEGSASISDTSGSLLFYTNGDTIWNKNHQLLLNGDIDPSGGHFSSTQSSLIVEQPSNDSIYYLFTTPGREGNGAQIGFQYTVINKNLQNGNGGVDLTKKNIFLFAPCSEQLTATSHCNGKDIWVIAYNLDVNSFYSYLLSDTGLSLPVISPVALAINAYGQLKASPNGKHLAGCGSSSLRLFAFNNQTGAVSDEFALSGVSYPWGIAFSPDNSKLYATTTISTTQNLLQYDLLAGGGDSAAVNASKQTVGSVSIGGYTGSLGSMQLGPDLKIYIVISYYPYLAVINNPNLSGTACSFVRKGLSLGGRNGVLGLPGFLDSRFMNIPFDVLVSNCKESPSEFTNSDTSYYTTWEWNFGDVASGSLNTDTRPNAFHNFSGSGSYLVSLIKGNGCRTDTVTKTIDIEYVLCDSLHIPNVFTPNQDGINDEFQVFALGFKEYSIKIFNRFGEEVFQTTDPVRYWDGRFKNSSTMLPEGVYYYVLNAVRSNDEKIEKEGYVSLFKN